MGASTMREGESDLLVLHELHESPCEGAIASKGKVVVMVREGALLDRKALTTPSMRTTTLPLRERGCSYSRASVC
jgi:hypothetical protein